MTYTVSSGTLNLTQPTGYSPNFFSLEPGLITNRPTTEFTNSPVLCHRLPVTVENAICEMSMRYNVLAYIVYEDITV